MRRKLLRSILTAVSLVAVLSFGAAAGANWESNYLQHLGSTGYAFVSVMAPSNAAGSQVVTINFKDTDTVVQSTSVTLAPGQVFALGSSDFDAALTGWEGTVEVVCGNCNPWASMVFTGSAVAGFATNWTGASTGGSGGSTVVCSTSPLPGCDTAEISKLVIKNNLADEKDKLLVSFAKGLTPRVGSEFADPQSSSAYKVCLYANTTLVGQAVVPPGTAKWQTVGAGKGFKYKDNAAADGGINKILLKGGKTGKATAPKVLVKGKGIGLPDVALPLAAPVQVQAVNDENGLCFDGSWADAQILRNDEAKGLFKAIYKTSH